MKNSILIINPFKAEESRLGYEEIKIIDLIFDENSIKNLLDDDYLVPIYNCKCLVKEGNIFSMVNIPLSLIEYEVKKGIYNIFQKN